MCMWVLIYVFVICAKPDDTVKKINRGGAFAGQFGVETIEQNS